MRAAFLKLLIALVIRRFAFFSLLASAARAIRSRDPARRRLNATGTKSPVQTELAARSTAHVASQRAVAQSPCVESKSGP